MGLAIPAGFGGRMARYKDEWQMTGGNQVECYIQAEGEMRYG
jgi:hypothetical protein